MRYTLLLADDSVTIQRVIELTFADEDVRVITVGDGQSAIDRLEADPPDIVLADVDMPNRDGYEVATYVRSHPKLAHIPVVLLTGAFEPIDQARAEAAGSSDVFAKPFEPQMVINRVRQLLGRKRPEDLEVPAPQGFAPSQPQQSPPAMNAPASPRPPARSSMAMNDEHATQQDQPARHEAGQPVQEPVSLDDYFDQLDAAFSAVLPPGAAPAQHDASPTEDDWIDIQEPDLLPPPEPLLAPPALIAVKSAMVVEPVIVVAPPPPAPPPPPALQVHPAAPAVVVIAAPAPPPPIPEPQVYMPPAPAPVEAAPFHFPTPAPAAVPPRPATNPFAELSAAKAEAAARPSVPVITDEVIEEVVARVLQRLTDRVVRETVTEIVSKTAERLVQEEILRIKTEGQ